MQKIVPHLWFDKEALEAAKWYVEIFNDSSILNTTIIYDTPSGNAELVDFQICGFRFSAMSAGPYFKKNSSISFMVSCNSIEEVERLHKHLSHGGKELMPLDTYEFSKKFAWIKDKYEVDWQLIYEEKTEHGQIIRPVLLFAGDVCGKAENAIEFYTDIFQNAGKGHISFYSEGEAMDSRAKINYGEINLSGTQCVLMDHGYGGEEVFNEGISLMVICESQNEIDKYWDMLSFVPEAEQCGWLKDKFGLSWQIVSKDIDYLMTHGTEEENKRVTKALLQMKKIDIKLLEKARLG